MLFTRHTHPGWLAVALDAQRITVAQVVRAGGARPRLAKLEDAARGGVAEAEALARMRRAFGLQRYRCTTALDGGAYQLVQVNAPAVPADEMRAALRWAVKDALDFPAEGAVVDVLQVPPDGAPAGRAPLALAVAARRERVAERVQAFQRAGLDLKAIDIAEAAQRNLAALFEQPGRGLAMLLLHEAGGLLTFTRDGELYAARRIDVAADAIAEDADAERRHAALDRVALELQRSLDNFDRQFSHVALQRVLVASTAGAAPLVAFLAQNVYLPVEAVDLAAAMDLDAFPWLADPAAQSLWLPAIGLALRPEA
ncbi:MAG TPA: agglutinin biogenesis protein MshI [Albitalea sp.]